MGVFKWAYGPNANLREPIIGLKEKGWQYADIPTAANFNWLFNQIEKDLRAIGNEFAAFKETINTDLAAIKQEMASVKRIAQTALENTTRHNERIDWHLGASRQICRGLRNMEQAIKHYHQNFPTQPWPLNDDGIRTNENEEV
jgi:hypothetical protein